MALSPVMLDVKQAVAVPARTARACHVIARVRRSCHTKQLLPGRPHGRLRSVVVGARQRTPLRIPWVPGVELIIPNPYCGAAVLQGVPRGIAIAVREPAETRGHALCYTVSASPQQVCAKRTIVEWYALRSAC